LLASVDAIRTGARRIPGAVLRDDILLADIADLLGISRQHLYELRAQYQNWVFAAVYQ
jgi:hypothetical protein